MSGLARLMNRTANRVIGLACMARAGPDEKGLLRRAFTPGPLDIIAVTGHGRISTGRQEANHAVTWLAATACVIGLSVEVKLSEKVPALVTDDFQFGRIIKVLEGVQPYADRLLD